jgi:hypothetical protein
VIYLIGLIAVLILGLKLVCFIAATAADMAEELTGSDGIALVVWIGTGLTVAAALFCIFN